MRVGSQITDNIRMNIFVGETPDWWYQVSQFSSVFLELLVFWRLAHLSGWSFPYFGRDLKKIILLIIYSI